MSTVSSAGSQIQNLTIPGALPSRKEATPEAPVDKVETGAQEKDNAGLIHKSFRLLGKAAGAPLGIIPGAVIGARKELKETEPSDVITPGGEKFLRGLGATTGCVIGALAGALSMSPLGFLFGVVGGTLIGAAIAGGTPKGMDATRVALKGMAKGSIQGMKKGAGYGGKLVDWVASKFSGSHSGEPAPPNEQPVPPQSENAA